MVLFLLMKLKTVSETVIDTFVWEKYEKSSAIRQLNSKFYHKKLLIWCIKRLQKLQNATCDNVAVTEKKETLYCERIHTMATNIL